MQEPIRQSPAEPSLVEGRQVAGHHEPQAEFLEGFSFTQTLVSACASGQARSSQTQRPPGLGSVLSELRGSWPGA